MYMSESLNYKFIDTVGRNIILAVVTGQPLILITNHLAIIRYLEISKYATSIIITPAAIRYVNDYKSS